MSAAGVNAGDGDRVLAPFGLRRCEVAANVATGGYRIISALDEAGPLPRAGQFYMLAGERGWGGEAGRPYLPRAFSVARATATPSGVRLEFLSETVGPGTAGLEALEGGGGLMVTGPLGRPFSPPRELAPGAAGAILVGGGVGIAPLAILRRELARAGVPQRVLLGFRDREHSGGVGELFGCEEVRLASEDGHTGHRGYVTDLLGVMLEGDSASGSAVYACGPPGMLEAVRTMCAERGVACELALEAPMACGFGSCFGCAIPLAAGGYMRLCVDGPVVRGDRVAPISSGDTTPISSGNTAPISSALRPDGNTSPISSASRPGMGGDEPAAPDAASTAPPQASPSGGAGGTASGVEERGNG